MCEQILHALADALVCDCDDPLLADVGVIAVEPVSGSSVVLATVEVDTGRFAKLNPALPDGMDLLDEVHTRLVEATGCLRAAIAGAIHRKRVPQLRFKVIPADAG